jgi:NAD(P)H-dependent FMN reductase
MINDQQEPTRFLIFSASLRNDSLNTRLAKLAAQLIEKNNGKVDFANMSEFDCPSYNQDLESNDSHPKGAQEFHDRILANDAFIIASPEYNGSLPAVLKNALDWASKSEDGGFSKVAFQGKKFVLLSASPGKAGGASALAHLKVVLGKVGGIAFPRQLSIPDAYNAFDEQGIKNPDIKAELHRLIKDALNQ